MNVTKRFVLLLLFCVPVVACAGLLLGSDWAIAAFVLCNLTALILFILDGVLTPGKQQIAVTRRLEETLSLSAAHEAVLTVRNRSDFPLFAEVTDDLPEYFHCEKMPDGKRIEAHAEENFSYRFIPVKRGEYRLPCITVRITGLLGLCTKQFAVPTEFRCRVCPNMRDLSEYGIRSLSRTLFLNGIRPLRVRADRGEFESLRPYAEGDSVRAVNWNATARKGEVIVNNFKPETNQYMYVMLDSSRVMNTRCKDILMLDYCINAAFLLADYVLRGGDNLGMEVFSARVDRFLKAGKGAGQFAALSEQMYDIESRESAADYAGAMAFLASQMRRRSLIFVFTDLFNAEEARRFADAVRSSLRGHLVYAITIRDPRTAEIAAGGGDRDDFYLRAAAVKAVRDRKAIAAVLRQAGILHMDCDPDKLSLSAVAAYLNVKREGVL